MLIQNRAEKTFTCNALIKLLAFAILLLTLVCCNNNTANRQIERSFYFWKSVFTLSDYEKQMLDSLQVKTIYIKFFDVDWDAERILAVPVAKIRFTDTAYRHYKIIPTVFITNACIQKIDSSQIHVLAKNIQQLLDEIINSNTIKDIPEFQLDCDWTAATKEKYFALLNDIQALMPNTKFSATIRLHQVKYVAKTGIPPVSSGLLMCYNMGNLKNPATKNSILETAELKKYIGSLANYPLPLDIALPLFDWKVLYRNNVYTGLLQNLAANAFDNSFSKKNANRYFILKDTLLQGYSLQKGDIIRDEQSSYKEIRSTAAVINGQLKNTVLRVSLYHLDSVILRKYTYHELESIYNSLH